MAYSVLDGLVTAWRLADWPTSRSPLSAKATMLGVVRAPSLFSMTRTSLPSMMATQEFVVPRSMPMTLAIAVSSFSADAGGPKHRARPHGENDRDVRGRAGPARVHPGGIWSGRAHQAPRLRHPSQAPPSGTPPSGT